LIRRKYAAAHRQESDSRAPGLEDIESRRGHGIKKGPHLQRGNFLRRGAPLKEEDDKRKKKGDEGSSVFALKKFRIRNISQKEKRSGATSNITPLSLGGGEGGFGTGKIIGKGDVGE